MPDRGHDQAGRTSDRTSFIGRHGRRIVEPGGVELRLGAARADGREVLRFPRTGGRRTVGFERRMQPEIVVERSED